MVQRPEYFSTVEPPLGTYGRDGGGAGGGHEVLSTTLTVCSVDGEQNYRGQKPAPITYYPVEIQATGKKRVARTPTAQQFIQGYIQKNNQT